MSARTPARRPFTKLAVAASSAHVLFELGARVGVPGSAVAGVTLPTAGFAAAAAWSWGRAERGADCDPALAGADAAMAAAAIAHLSGWPRRSGPVGLPVLAECEGMRPELMGPYTAILYTGGLTALAALVVEDGPSARWPAALAVAAVPALVVLQQLDHRARVRQAGERPRWWNRRLQVPAGVS